MRWMWIDRITHLEPGRRLVAVKNVSMAEEHLHDHFPARDGSPAFPVMPASLILEGVAQTAGILVGHARVFREKVILAKIGKAELARDAAPGDTLRYSATILHLDTQGASTSTTIEIASPTAPGVFETIGAADIVFSHADHNTAGTTLPAFNFVFSDSFKTILRTSGFGDE
ncbi:MAG: beta-hydroxyacyl-ACP dehydratase [Phycisphaeraceae bacterium]|nr:MAG: beta-hydroxyacyl-ACP dehydratase [Phycisphaeraceae bacterium]